MKTLKDIAAEQHAARAPHDDPLTDRLLAEIIALAEEVCVLRDRVDTAQHLFEAGESVSETSIDAFSADAQLTEVRLARHQAYFETLFARLSGINEQR